MGPLQPPDAPKPYNKAFGQILEREKLHSDVLDSATRNHCLQIAENGAAVEGWRATLPMNLRQTLNHPGSVYKRWKKATLLPDSDAPAKLSCSAQELDPTFYAASG